MHWLAQAPSNIALIKYMGKKDDDSNLPANASLSYTLNHLLSTVKLEVIPGKNDIWEPLEIPGASQEFVLSESGQKRFIDHLQRIREYFDYTGGFIIQSCNNFPHSSGLASSASSFAALTKCACFALSELTHKPLPSIDEQAQLSRLGSGSSCRSFYSPWALWSENSVSPVDLPFTDLIHQVVIISAKEKQISSSEAHRRVKTSTFYDMRNQKAADHLKLLMDALNAKDWPSIYKICWDEFQDMHHLFRTCSQPFEYMSPNSMEVLKLVQQLWDEKGDGPIVTMDAGPNIHLLYRPDQADMALRFKVGHLLGNYDVL